MGREGVSDNALEWRPARLGPGFDPRLDFAHFLCLLAGFQAFAPNWPAHIFVAFGPLSSLQFHAIQIA